MPNNPIQVVLNTNDYIFPLEVTRKIVNKDFYENKDVEFVTHKNKILTQLNMIRKNQVENEYSEVSFAKLTLNPLALAKSHRPTRTIFRRDITPIVGAGDLGELFVELQPSSIEKVSAKIKKAEEKTKPNPSKIRCELGSIEKIKPYIATDKRNFSVHEGLTWISNPRTGGAYIVELFETLPPRQDWDKLPSGKFDLYKSFVDGLHSFKRGLFAFWLVGSDEKAIMMGVKIEESTEPSSIQLMPTQPSVQRSRVINVNQDVGEHAKLLKFLDSHPLVKKIVLPPIIVQSRIQDSRQIGNRYSVPVVEKRRDYPIIGIVDGGVSPLMEDWIEDQWELLSDKDRDEAHGTFIAGLALSSATLNGQEVCKELDGCRIVDIDLFPKEEIFENYYPAGPFQFLQELEVAVRELKARTDVRIFNFSFNTKERVSSDEYSPYARILDGIAENNDVIFVISAGNTGLNDSRREWSSDHSEAISALAFAVNDKIKTPAESCRNISVAALNPPGMDKVVPFAPSNYSCRGPGMRVGLKPELAHVGGSGTKTPGGGHGLYSVDTSGRLIDGCGTSYAVPHVAKTLASIIQSIEGDVSRETLIALLVHHASLPEVLTDKQFKDVAKQLVGFGMPSSSIDILEGSEHSITLLFADRVRDGHKMSFKFVWPPSLVKNGKCYGYAKLTLVSTPPFDYRFGSEFVRINIKGYLRQEGKNNKDDEDKENYEGRLKFIYLPETSSRKLYEKDQIEHAFKWSPIKVSEGKFKGKGRSANWKLVIEYLTRDGESLPDNGVPFTALLTISDLDNSKPVFREMRQSLQSLGVKMRNIREETRVVRRV